MMTGECELFLSSSTDYQKHLLNDDFNTLPDGKNRQALTVRMIIMLYNGARRNRHHNAE